MLKSGTEGSTEVWIGDRRPHPTTGQSRGVEIAEATQLLRASIRRAFNRSWPSGGAATLFFSGGLDSSLLALLAQGSGRETTLFTVGLPGSRDFFAAANSAILLGTRFVPRAVTQVEVKASVQHLRKSYPNLRGNDLSVQVSMDLALSHAPGAMIVCGQGADELFIGYRHTFELAGVSLAERGEKDLRKLRETDWPITLDLAVRHGKVLVAPFLDTDFIAQVSRIPWEVRKGDEPKSLLREVARSLGLPEEIARLPKRAFQYGTGIHKVVQATMSNYPSTTVPPLPFNARGRP